MPSANPDRAGADGFEVARWIRPGDTVVWAQLCAEPIGLTRALVEQRHDISGRIRCLVGIPAGDTLAPEHGDVIDVLSYCGTGSNRELLRAGVLDILPLNYSDFAPAIRSRRLPVDVVLLQVAPAGPDGRYPIGLAEDYLDAALEVARVVIAQVSPAVPTIRGVSTLDPARIDLIVPSGPGPRALPPAPAPTRPAVAAVAAGVAELIGDGASLQIGIGTLPELVLAELGSRRDLGIHTAILTPAITRLMRAGVITNACKEIDRGQTVGTVVAGDAECFEFLHDNPAVTLRPTGYTHAQDVLGRLGTLVAVNGALEVDLAGRVNSEVLGGEYVGAVGGLLDFTRAAHRSPDGIPIFALESSARGTSRIVERLSGPATVNAADAGVVVTEYGRADLRGQPLAERIDRLVRIAHPDHREQLAAAGYLALHRSR